MKIEFESIAYMHYHQVSYHSFYNIFIDIFYYFYSFFEEFDECLNSSHSFRNFPSDQNVKRRIVVNERQSNQNG